MSEISTLQQLKRWLWKRQEAAAFSDPGAFTRLYESTSMAVFRYVYALSGGPRQEAEDLTSEVYARAWKTRHGFRGNERAALGWLLQIARNLAIDLSRRRKVRNIAEDVEIEMLVATDGLPEPSVFQREQLGILWNLLSALAPDVREMLVLRYILGWQVRRIAAHLHISQNTTSVTIRRALQRLQRDWPQS